MNKLPEICFAGRSNVGKSSLLNAVLLKPTFTRTSCVPGTTKQLCFCQVNGRLRIIDFPGYGFAQDVSLKESDHWIELMIACFRRRQLRHMFLLIDARFGIKDSDAEMIDLFKSTAPNLRFSLILTKTDLLNPVQLGQRLTLLSQEPILCAHKYNFTDTIMVSSHTHAGIAKLRDKLSSYARCSSTVSNNNLPLQYHQKHTTKENPLRLKSQLEMYKERVARRRKEKSFQRQQLKAEAQLISSNAEISSTNTSSSSSPDQNEPSSLPQVKKNRRFVSTTSEQTDTSKHRRTRTDTTQFVHGQ
jgi:GTP-binding protein